MTLIVDPKKISALVVRMNTLSAEKSHMHNARDPSYCVGWRGATNAYAIELLALLNEAADEARQQRDDVATAVRIGTCNDGEPIFTRAVCIDCDQPCDPARNPLRCLVCQLDGAISP